MGNSTCRQAWCRCELAREGRGALAWGDIDQRPMLPHVKVRAAWRRRCGYAVGGDPRGPERATRDATPCHAVTVDRASLARDLDARCRLTGELTLRSGQMSTEYFDKYRFESDPVLVLRVAEAMVPLVPSDTELLGGPELGGIPLVTVLSSMTGLPAVFVRKQAKTYGTRRLAQGAEVSGRRVPLVEDVLTTGGAVRDVCDALRALGASVEVVLCAIDRSGRPCGPVDDVGLETRAVLLKCDLERHHAGAVAQ